MAKILRKLTIKTAIGSKAAILKIAEQGKPSPTASEGEPVELLSVIGRVTGIKAGESDSGPFVKLIGEFEAVNLQTGETIPDVQEAILPNFVGDKVARAIKDGAQSVDFAVKLFVTFKESAAVMYEFSAESLIPQAPSNAILDLKRKLADQGIALAAPSAPQLVDASKATVRVEAKVEPKIDAKQQSNKKAA